MVTIIDYNIGNLSSISNMLKKIGVECVISNSIEVLKVADKLILPGVGHYDYGMQKLHQSRIIPILKERVLERKAPILGICLGVQLFTEGSDEGTEPGLGFITGKTVTFDRSKCTQKLKIPHIGWSEIKAFQHSRLFENMYEDPRFYFVHSYHLELDNPKEELCTVEYGYEFCAGIERGNILGVQFHPEKSHKFGMKLLENFVKNY